MTAPVDEAALHKFQEQLRYMVVKQREHNEHVHPQWDQQGYPFCRAIWMECAELIEHHGWKWWKKQDQDLDQVRLEIVDIWHFGLSFCMVQGLDEEQLSRVLVKGTTSRQKSEFLSSVEDLARRALDGSFDIRCFANVLNSVSMSLDLLYSFYMGKNTLNVFRQLNGYKEGTYQKHWVGGNEDNYSLVEILLGFDSEEEISERRIMEELASRYPKDAVIPEY